MKPFGDPLAPVRIFVRGTDLDRATLVLHEVDHRPPNPDVPSPLPAKGAWWVFAGSLAVVLLLEIAGLLTCGKLSVLGIVPACT